MRLARAGMSGMWHELLGLGFLMSLNPILIGVVVLMISRPRPVQNLLVFWLGLMLVNIPSFLIPLSALHEVSSLAALSKDLAIARPGSSVQPLQLGMGVFALSVAAVLVVRHRTRTRRRVEQSVAVGADGGALIVADAEISGQQPRRAPGGALASVRAGVQRLYRRLHDAWESGSLWVALALGLGGLPAPPLVLYVAARIVASEAGIGTQITVAIAFVLAMFAVYEIALLSYVVAPGKTQAVLDPLHNWALAHRHRVLVTLFTAVGLWQVITGTGLL